MKDKERYLRLWEYFVIFREELRELSGFNACEDSMEKVFKVVIETLYDQGEITKNEIRNIYESLAYKR